MVSESVFNYKEFLLKHFTEHVINDFKFKEHDTKIIIKNVQIFSQVLRYYRHNRNVKFVI